VVGNADVGGAASGRATQLPAAVGKRHHPGQAVAFVFIVIVAVLILRSIAEDPKIHWSVWKQYVLNHQVLTGLWTTIELSVISMAGGIVLGVVLALMRLSASRYLRLVSWVYIWIVRSVPLLLWILLWGNLGLFFDQIHIGVPFTHLALVDVSTNSVFTPFVASIVALALNEGPYMGEIVRGGILSVPAGQSEAATAFGLTRGQAMRHVILPQAMRAIIPPTGNQVINMLKATSLVSVVAGGDLLTQTSNIAANNFHTIELLFVAAFWYLVVTGLASIGQAVLERRVQRSSRATGGGAAAEALPYVPNEGTV
jgi:polar amino acid transport system permease protein